MVDDYDNKVTNILGHIESSDKAGLRDFSFTKISELNEKLEFDWLIEGIVERNKIGLIVAPPAVGKTFVALDMGLSITTGKAWHGHEVKVAPVIMIAGEGYSGLKRRAKAWETENTSIENTPFYVSSCPVQLFNRESAEIVNKHIEIIAAENATNPGLIIIDTLARNYGGAENSNDDMGAFIYNIDNYLKNAFDCTVMIIHHSGHDHTRARGASSLFGAIDFEYRLALKNNVIEMTCPKMKDAPTPPDKHFKLKTIKFTDTISSCVLEPTERVKPKADGLGVRQSKSLNELKIMHQEAKENLVNGGYSESGAKVEIKHWHSRLIEKNILTGKYTNQSFSKVKIDLEKRELIRTEEIFVYLVSSQTASESSRLCSHSVV